MGEKDTKICNCCGDTYKLDPTIIPELGTPIDDQRSYADTMCAYCEDRYEHESSKDD